MAGDPVQVQLGEPAGGDLAGADQLGLAGGAGEGEVGIAHGAGPYEIMAASMGALADVVEGLCGFERRGSCTDAERRAALWLHDDLRRRGHEAWVETVWVRPQWWWSLAAHAALGVAASLVCTAVPEAGLAAAVVAFASYALEVGGSGGLLGLLRFRRATQLVVVEPADPEGVA